MPLSQKMIAKYLSLYGSEVEYWPLPLQKEAAKLRGDFTFAALVEKQKRFETLLEERTLAEPAPQLAERIIAAAYYRRQFSSQSVIDWLREVLMESLPKPAFALAAMLVIGVAIGFTSDLSSGSEEDISIAYFDDNGAVL